MSGETDDVCRICLGTEKEGLISPCAGCRGSSAFVHYHCLVAYYNDHAVWWDLICPTCKHAYEGRVAVDLGIMGLKRTRAKYGPKSKEVAAMLVSLGIAHQKMRDCRKNVEFQEEALTIIENATGANSIHMAAPLTNLANAYGELGNIERKKELLERALAIQDSILGKNTRDVAITLVNLGTACGMLGDRHKMKTLLETALAVFEAEPKSNRREICATLVNLGGVHGDLGDHQKMKELLVRSLSIAKSEYGLSHFQVAVSLTSLVWCNIVLGEVEEAKTQQDQASRIARATSPYPSGAAAEVFFVLAGAFQALGKFVEATTLWNTAANELVCAVGDADAQAKMKSVRAESAVFWESASRSDVAEWFSKEGSHCQPPAAKRRRLRGKQSVS